MTSRLVRIRPNTFKVASEMKIKLGYTSFADLFDDSIFILKNKDVKKKKILRELDF